MLEVQESTKYHPREDKVGKVIVPCWTKGLYKLVKVCRVPVNTLMTSFG